MSLFYDPKKRQPQPWVMIALVIIPIFVIVIVLIVGKHFSQEKKNSIKTEEASEDIFNKF